MEGDYSKLPPQQDGGYYQQPQQPQPYGQPVYGQPQPGYEQAGYYQPQPTYAQQPYDGQPQPEYSLHGDKDQARNLLREDLGEKFPTDTTYRDLPFLIAFLVHIVVVFVILIIGVAKKNPNYDNGSYGGGSNYNTYFVESDDSSISLPAGKVIGTLIGCLAFGAFFTIAWTFLFRKRPTQIVYFSFISAIALYLVAAIIYFIAGVVVLGVIFIIIGLINLWILFAARHKVEFAKHMLQCVAELVDQYPATVVLAFLSIIPMVIWQGLFTVTFFYACFKFSGGGQFFAIIYLLFSYYWTCQVIKNTVHLTSSGVFASWYFLSPNMPESPTAESFKRAATTSFGSVCLGSLLVALIKTLKALVSNNSIIGLILRCFLAIIENLMKYFNRYAFAQVAIYGKTFCQSARATWNMFVEHGFDAVINDDITGMVLNMSCIACGLFTGAVTGLLALIVFGRADGDGSGAFYFFGFIGFFIGFSICLLTMEVFDSGVATIFVCFVEQPDRLAQTSPHFYHKFQESFGSSCSSLFHHQQHA